MVNPLDLSGRQVMVTGASSGIGRQTAILLSQLGARVILVARNQVRLEETLARLSGSAHTLQVFDLAQLDEIPNWLKGVAAGAGPLYGLVHCAGIRITAPVNVLSPQKLEQVLRVNVSSAAMLARAFRQRGCYEAGGGLVFLSSVAALAGASGLAAYSASKAALLGLTKALALELAPAGIRVNSIAAGLVRTEMTEQIARNLTPEQFQALEAQHPLGLGTAEDVAYGIAYLLAATGRWITGSVLILDGGFTAQ